MGALHAGLISGTGDLKKKIIYDDGGATRSGAGKREARMSATNIYALVFFNSNQGNTKIIL